MSNINLFDPSAEDANGKSVHPENKLEDLIVFGYSCKLFRDDFSAKAIDRGQSLIPWNGDENVMIDRCAQKNEFFFFFFSYIFLFCISQISNDEKKGHHIKSFDEFFLDIDRIDFQNVFIEIDLEDRSSRLPKKIYFRF